MVIINSYLKLLILYWLNNRVKRVFFIKSIQGIFFFTIRFKNMLGWGFLRT